MKPSKEQIEMAEQLDELQAEINNLDRLRERYASIAAHGWQSTEYENVTLDLRRASGEMKDLHAEYTRRFC